MSVNTKRLFMSFPPDGARQLLESHRRNAQRDEDFVQLSKEGLSASRVQELAAIFGKATGFDGLEQEMDALITMKKSTNQARQDAIENIKKLWNALTGLSEGIKEQAEEEFAGTGLSKNDIQFILHQEAFQSFFKMFRYNQACKEWKRKGEKPPCSMF